MNCLFLGCRVIASSCFFELFEILKDNGVIICFVVGDEHVLSRSRAKDIECLDVQKFDANVLDDVILSHSIDCIISVQFDRIISAKTLRSVAYRAFNLHNAEIPKYKGHHSISHAIFNNEKFYTSTIHRMHEIVDSGEVICSRQFAIDADDSAHSLYKKSVEVAKELLLDFGASIKTYLDMPASSSVLMGGNFYNRDLLPSLLNCTSLTDEAEFEQRVKGGYFPPYNLSYMLINKKRVYLVPESEINNLMGYFKPLNLSSSEK